MNIMNEPARASECRHRASMPEPRFCPEEGAGAQGGRRLEFVHVFSVQYIISPYSF